MPVLPAPHVLRVTCRALLGELARPTVQVLSKFVVPTCVAAVE
jgi:hypothetical protein